MTCPYLTEVLMVFCQASAVKKLIPTDRVSTASACEGDAFGTCPLYQEALRRAQRSVEQLEEEEKKAEAELSAETKTEKKKGEMP
jgi:hypothetical protein